MEKKYILINKTQDPIRFIADDGTKIILEPVLPTPYITTNEVSNNINDIENVTYILKDKNGKMHTITFKDSGNIDRKIVGLPHPREGVVYIVSKFIAAIANDRDDLIFNDSQIRYRKIKNKDSISAKFYE